MNTNQKCCEECYTSPDRFSDKTCLNMNCLYHKTTEAKECPERKQHCWDKGTGHEANPKSHKCCFCGASQEPLPDKEWVEEFENEFIKWADNYQELKQALKSFISQLLSSERAKLLETIERMKEEIDYEVLNSYGRDEAEKRNKFIEDLLNKLK